MNRPLKNFDDAMLREEYARISANIGRLNDQAHHFQNWLEMQDVRFMSSMPGDIRTLFASRDYEALLRGCTEVALCRLTDELQQIEAELEQRHLDDADAMDRSGGIAA